ncbi:MAG: hypothetical protein M3151_13420 [Actinomycetota bacterium]|nr:hypothetical protein [Actinomycetota bacterium]
MGHERENQKSTGVGFVLLVYASSRLFYLLAGALLARVVPTSRFQSITADVPFGTMNLWSHWDGEHYAALAAGGYLQPPENVSPAFFPLYPLLMRSFAELFGGPSTKVVLSFWGPLISLAFLPFALYFVYRIAEDGWGEKTARATVLALSFFPTTFFLNSAYTESLFLSLSAGSLWALRVRKDLLLACVLAALAGATRNVGVFLTVPLVLEWVKGAREGGWDRAKLAGGLSLGLVPMGLVGYMAYLWWLFGDPFLFYTDQGKWGRQPVDPLATVARVWEAAGEGARRLLDPRLWADPSLGNLANHLQGANNLFNLAFLIFAGIVLIVGVRHLPPDLSVYALLLLVPGVLFGTPQSPLMGTPRYVLVAFPLFIVLGLMAKNRLLFGGWLVLSTVASLVLCALFVSWRFVA